MESTSVDDNAATTDTYVRTTGTNRVASITTSGSSTATRSFTYDARGNLSAETRPAVNVATAYDGYGRLISHSQSGEATLAFAYNGMDDRISASESALTKRYVYDSQGRVIGQYGATATAVRGEYIYLMPDGASDGSSPFGGDDGMGGYSLLAVMTPDGLGAGNTVPHYVHSNHLGAPMFSTDAAGQIITPGQYSQPVFPGQLQTRADLYYNRYRDYDPTTGRYIQADPIGLAGGPNSYGYANANPMRYVDPTGEAAVAGAVPLCFSNPLSAAACATGAVVGGGYLAYKAWEAMPPIPPILPTLILGAKYCIGMISRPFDDVPDVPPLEMAKGGNQNKENEWSRAAKNSQPNDPCGWLDKAYNNPNMSSMDRQKIKTAQKALGCRRRGGY